MERITKYRGRILLAMFFLLLCFFSLRLYQLQVVDTKNKPSNTTTYTTMTRVKAARGEILDQNGNVLVGNRASYDLVINHYVLTSADNANDYILRLVQVCREQNISYTDHFPITSAAPYTYTLENYNAAWQGYFRTFLSNRGGWDSDISAPLLLQKLRKSYDIPTDWSDEDARLVIGIRYELSLRMLTTLPIYVFLSDASDEARAAILDLNIPGLKVEASTVREYYTTYAAHILGYTSAMSPEQWAEYEKIGYDQDALVGQSGFELAFEEYLHGTDGWRIDTVAADGTLLESRYDPEPKAGNNVEVTIDLGLQMIAEDALADEIRNLREKSWVGETEGGAVVVMDVKTGQVLACASYPTYDPSKLLSNYQEISSQPYGPLNNRALQFAYPPGSVYKMSMVVAGIDSGLITKDTQITDEGVFTKYAGFSPACLAWTREGTTHGAINAAWALCYSCNYFFYDLADRMSLQSMDDTAKGFGLGEATGVELPEKTGYRANRETKALLHKGDQAYFLQGDKILSGIGQSDNQFTPMQLCVYTSTLANQGTRYKATFLNRVVSTDYRSLLYENRPVIASQMKISEQAYEAYSQGMLMVGREHPGTASIYFIDYPVKVACKTGTAQTGNTKAPDNGSFVCYAPLDDPQIAIAIYAEKAGTGGYLSPIAVKILDSYFADHSTDISTQVTYENQIS